ncbi:MAG: TerB family tellurite resistance protein [Deltaproteobacteria bacterium]|nr:TerB family tellurite resistance protein [Deltaproteobacteria bacterium]
MVRSVDLLNLTPKFIMDSDAEIPEEKIVNYLAALLEVARMGGVSVEEHKLSEYLVSALGLSPEVIRRAARLIEEQSLSMGELVARIEEPELRVCILRDAYVMAMMDEKVDHMEWMALERLAGALGLSHKIAEKVTKMVDSLVELHKELDKLVKKSS